MRYEYLTFDCYGTLVDWRNGILEAFAAAVKPGTVLPEPERILSLHARHEAAVQAGPYRSYRAVLTETARRMAADLGQAGAFDSYAFLAESVPRWRPFPEVPAALAELRRRGMRLGILSNIDDDLLAATLERIQVPFDRLITAQQVGSYKPSPAHFEEARRWIGGGRWLHVAQSLFHDIRAARELGIDAAWINRHGEPPATDLEAVPTFTDLAGLVEGLA